MKKILNLPELTPPGDSSRKLFIGNLCLHFPAVFGFCGGVLRALRVLQDAVEQNPDRRIWLLGEIIHNDTVNESFRKAGVRILPETHLEKIFACADIGDVVVIPAFGLPREADRRVREFCAGRCSLVDTTCTYVKRSWDFVSTMAEEGRTILIYGKPGHPETLAILSRAVGESNAVILIKNLTAAETVSQAVRNGRSRDLPAEWVRNPEKLRLDWMAVTSQTTMHFREMEAVTELLAEAVAVTGGDLARLSTVCNATRKRQESAAELCAGGCDLVLVVGGFSSSNTNELYQLARSEIPHVYFIRDAEAVDANRIEHYLPSREKTVQTEDWLPPGTHDIGLLAGASCPGTVIDDVVRKLSQIQNANPASSMNTGDDA